MDTLLFKKYLSDAEALTPVQRPIVVEHIQRMVTANNNQRVIEESLQQHSKCPHCFCTQFVKFGTTNGQQRYRCKGCKHTFIALTGSPFLRTRDKSKLLDYAECLANSMTIRASAKKVGLTVSRAFNWRHRFLENLEKQQPTGLTGVVEADEAYFPRNYKGQRSDMPRASKHRGGPIENATTSELVPVLIAMQRGTRIEADCILSSRSRKIITTALRPILSPDAILSTDGNGSYSYAAKKLGVKSGYFVARLVGPGGNAIWHVQNVNAYTSRLKNWLVRFHGVATKYLKNYLGWRRLLDKLKDNVMPQQFLFHTLHNGYLPP